MIKTAPTTSALLPDGTSNEEPGEPSRAGGEDDGSGQPAPEPEPPGLTISIEGDEPSDLDSSVLRDAISRVLDHLELDQGTLAVRIVGDEEMASLHQQFAGQEGSTDVLTFDHLGGSTGDGSHQATIEADIAVCHDVARRESRRRGHDLTRELILYVIHGVLHCLGYDDHDEDAYEKMHRREDEILEAIGIGRTFGRE